jgi:ABC-type Mn2+/Zn2+ transport system permease subunit
VALAVGASVGGLYLSYYASIAAGASVAAVMVAVYLGALALRTVRGAATRSAAPLTSRQPIEG